MRNFKVSVLSTDVVEHEITFSTDKEEEQVDEILNGIEVNAKSFSDIVEMLDKKGLKVVGFDMNKNYVSNKYSFPDMEELRGDL